MRELLAAQVPAFTPGIGARELDRLAAYLELLAKWSRAYNLTAIRVPADMVTHHVLDSLAVLPWIAGKRVADIGTGAGLPGLVLAIADTGREYVLVDSGAKKIRFCSYVVDTLELANVATVHARCEDYRPGTGFDTVVSRAFTAIPGFVQGAGHLCAERGRMLAMKGGHPAHELERLPAGWQAETTRKLSIPGLDAERHVTILTREQR